MLTREQLQAALQTIKWNLRPVGPRHWRPVNHLGEVVALVVHGDTLRTDTWGPTRRFWGEKASEHGDTGSISFELSQCELDIQGDAVHVHCGGAFMSFYNHTLPAQITVERAA